MAIENLDTVEEGIIIKNPKVSKLGLIPRNRSTALIPTR